MTESQRQRSERVVKGGIVLPIISIVLLFVFWRLGMPWVALPLAVLLMAFYLFMPGIVRRKLDTFHKESMRLLSQGKADEVIDMAERDIILQLFAPGAPLDGKMGLAYSILGEYAAAATCFESALRTADDSERGPIVMGLTKALFVTGNLARAESEGRRIIEAGTRFPELLTVVARARIGQGKLDDWTVAYLNNAEQLSPDADVELMVKLCRIEIAIIRRQQFEELDGNADSNQEFIRAWIHMVRGKIRLALGKLDDAKKSFSLALKEDRTQGFVSAETRDLLGRALAQGAGPLSPAQAPIDPVMMRKRKKRR